jgi:uncharacterized protein (TIGR03083 family)
MTNEIVRWRAIFETAVEAFVEVVGEIDAGSWESHGLGEWTVRDLVGHASRAMLTIELYLARQSGEIAIGDAVAYLLGAGQAVEAARESVAQRGRDAGAALGAEPAVTVREIAERVIALVERTADDATCVTPFGTITLGDYIETRSFELTVHTLDCCQALGIAPPDELAGAVTACLGLLAEAIGETPKAAEVLLALTGRRSLPDDLGLF